MKNILICVGGRPNMMKAASFFRVADQFPKLNMKLLHTGQHYSTEMDQVFFDQLGLPKPDFHLEVGSAPHEEQKATISQRFKKVLDNNPFDLVVVIGDMNSTIACARTAKKKDIKVAHVEAGLRSFDETMPEEINRKETDHISDFLFTTEASGNQHLQDEGIDQNKVFFVGNTMIDTLVSNLEHVKKEDVLKVNHLDKHQYCVLTLHRPANVDEVQGLVDRLSKIAAHVPAGYKIVFPVHPRTQKAVEDIPKEILERYLLIGPQPYFSFMSLVYHSAFVLTDSGGIQEETTYLKKPCFTLRPNTERPSTTEIGSNFLIFNDLERVKPLLDSFDVTQAQIPPLWDGKTGVRILEKFEKLLG